MNSTESWGLIRPPAFTSLSKSLVASADKGVRFQELPERRQDGGRGGAAEAHPGAEAPELLAPDGGAEEVFWRKGKPEETEAGGLERRAREEAKEVSETEIPRFESF